MFELLFTRKHDLWVLNKSLTCLPVPSCLPTWPECYRRLAPFFSQTSVQEHQESWIHNRTPSPHSCTPYKKLCPLQFLPLPVPWPDLETSRVRQLHAADSCYNVPFIYRCNPSSSQPSVPRLPSSSRSSLAERYSGQKLYGMRIALRWTPLKVSWNTSGRSLVCLPPKSLYMMSCCSYSKQIHPSMSTHSVSAPSLLVVAGMIRPCSPCSAVGWTPPFVNTCPSMMTRWVSRASSSNQAVYPSTWLPATQSP